MIRGHVGIDRQRGAPRQGRELQLRELDDDAVGRRQLRQPLDERHPDVPTQHGWMGLVGGQERCRQGGRGRLALRPGDPDRRRWAQAQEQIRLADEGGRSGSAGAGGGQASESITQARFRRREVGVDRGRRRDEVGLPPGACRVNRRPRHDVQALLGQVRHGRRKGLEGPAVIAGHDRARTKQEAGQRNAAAGEAQHGYVTAFQGAGSDVGHRQPVQIDGLPARGGRSRAAHADCHPVSGVP